MQQSPLTLRQRLIDAVDERYHVKDMAAIVEVLGTLERLPVTKELLETTRLGKTVNEFRKRINNEKLAKRAKALVKKWRDAVLEPTEQSGGGRPLNGTSSSSVSEGPGPGPGSNHGQPPPLSSFNNLQQLGYNSTSSSPKFANTMSSKVSPSGSQNSNNSLSPRILAAVNSNSNNSRNGSSANNPESLHRHLLAATANMHHLAANISSPLLNSASLRVSSPSNKTKSPFGPTSSSNKSPLSTSSYAPNTEVVARTNAANKRLRIDDDSQVDLNLASGPPNKKARTLMNGTGIVGTLDDPLILDELSKDSVISRTSDNSDGSTSKLVSNISSIAVLSAAPSPLAENQDSNLSPPLSVGFGANSSTTIISVTTDKSSFQSTDFENSVVNAGVDNTPVGAPVQTAPKRGRKRKQRDFVDSESLLREQIAKAKAEGKIRTIERLSREALDDELSRSADLAGESFQRAQATALKPENPVIQNEIVEKYLQSQNVLRAHMEKEFKDAVARNEIPLQSDDVKPTEDPKVKSKKKKEKKKDKKDGSNDKSSITFPTESEILSRLPPIDPQILADFEDYVYYENPVEPEEDQKEPKSDLETENPINKPTSLSLSNQQTNNQQNKFIATKIDWGDSDEDDDFEEVKIPEEESSNNHQPTKNINESDKCKSPIIIPNLDDVAAIPPVDNNNVILQTIVMDVEENTPLREVEESEVERLHAEKIVNLNGNKDKDGHFKEWHETFTVESMNGDLHILPYTIIDF